MNILAIDPGNKESAYAVWDGQEIKAFGKLDNKELKEDLVFNQRRFPHEPHTVIIEMIASYGMPVGREVFETCLYIGQLMQLCETLGIRCELVYRKDAKMHFCNSMKAKDSNIRQALIDRFGGKGTKKDKGIFYGVSADVWSAVAIAVYYHDTSKVLQPA